MKNLLLFFVFITIIVDGNLFGQQNTKLISESLYNPSDFKVLNPSRLLISDNTTDFPIYLVSIDSDMVLNRIEQGNGPGELSTMHKTISIVDERIYVWDYGRQILHYYSHDLDYIGSKAFNNLGSIYSIAISGGSVLVMDSSEDFIKIFKYDETTIIGSKLKSFSINNHKRFEQFENRVIRQAFKIVANKDDFIIANEFTSLLFSVNKDGLKFETIAPLDITQEVNEGIYISTDLLYNALCSLDVEYHSESLYVLSKGEKASASDLSSTYNNRIDEYLEDFINTETILIYDQFGTYQDRLTLENPIKKVEFNGKKLFYLSTIGGDPVIGSYTLAQLENNIRQ